MIKAQVITYWKQRTNAEGNIVHYPALFDTPHQSCRDITGQAAEQLSPSPNMLVCEIVCEDAVLAQIAADPAHLILEQEIL